MTLSVEKLYVQARVDDKRPRGVLKTVKHLSHYDARARAREFPSVRGSVKKPRQGFTSPRPRAVARVRTRCLVFSRFEKIGT
jgi:hypothetical protein